jgi:uncharacterized protein (DUF1778 family)
MAGLLVRWGDRLFYLPSRETTTALLQPPEPNARLKRAAKAYLRRGGQRTGA